MRNYMIYLLILEGFVSLVSQKLTWYLSSGNWSSNLSSIGESL